MSQKSSVEHSEDLNLLREKATIEVEPSVDNATVVPKGQSVNVSLDTSLVPPESETNMDVQLSINFFQY